MRLNRLSQLILILVLLTSAGCAAMQIQSFVVDAQRPMDAARFLEALDETVRKSAAEDASSFRIHGFPYLRTNRFLASLKNKITTDEQRTLWVERLRRLDLEARQREIANLPESRVTGLTEQFGLPQNRDALIRKVLDISAQLLGHDQSQPGFYPALDTALNYLPQEYSLLRRAVGLYPLFALPVMAGTKSAQNEFTGWHTSPLEKLSLLGKLKTYGPSEIAGETFDKIHPMFKIGRAHV